MTDQERVFEAIEQCFKASNVPPTSGDIAAAVLAAVADIVAPEDLRYYTASLLFDHGYMARNIATRNHLLKLAKNLGNTDHGALS